MALLSSQRRQLPVCSLQIPAKYEHFKPVLIKAIGSAWTELVGNKRSDQQQQQQRFRKSNRSLDLIPVSGMLQAIHKPIDRALNSTGRRYSS